MSLRPINQPILQRRESGSSVASQILKGLGSRGKGSGILGSIIQNMGVGRIRTPRRDRGSLPRGIIPDILKTERAQRTRETAARRAVKIPEPQSVRRPAPQVFDLTPGIPIERISEVPRAPRVVSAPPPRFSVPGLEQLGGGAPIVHLPAPAPAPVVAPKEPPVSLHKGLIKSIGSGLQGAITQRLGGTKAIPIVAGAATAAGRVLPALGRVLGSRTVAAGSAGLAIGSLFGGGGDGGVCPSGEHLNKQDGIKGPKGTYCVRNRRMNFGNARAARRSVRRLKGARKLLRDIERMMPTKTRTKTVKVPVHHDHHAHH